MPTFDFQCQDCQHVFEFARPFGSTTLPNCPQCDSANVQKMIAPPNIHFKGTGFYKTDSSAKTEEPPADQTKETKEKPADATKATNEPKQAADNE